jgi:nucleotide-binding universal stress UspA family protein
MISSILVHVDETRHCPSRLALAAAISRRFDAELVGLFVVPPPTVPPLLSDDVGATCSERFARHRQSTMARAEEHFAALKRQYPAAAWRVGESKGFGDVASAIIREGRRADLIIMGQSNADSALPEGSGMAVQDVMMASGKPVLIVPHAGHFPDVGRRPLVAWTESREAARALHDALPLCRDADKIHLLEVGPAGAPPEEVALRKAGLESVRRYVEAHGLSATTDYEPATTLMTEASLILTRAEYHAADLLVMGGYGHSRLQELMLGGMTRSVLSSMTLPVLMSH